MSEALQTAIKERDEARRAFMEASLRTGLWQIPEHRVCFTTMMKVRAMREQGL